MYSQAILGSERGEDVLGSERGGGQAGVHVLVFWVLESSKMCIPSQFWALRGGGRFGL